ncbi:unnamed protein product [Gongylonema pulchrum]|uniref:Uncharacterized protein n=1 Tax=Gongylonema pulchrum TaxID=637853 RepID=A0A183E1Q5_9BILA|nr:unnamed protein product [Gongylonema pulchrum]
MAATEAAKSNNEAVRPASSFGEETTTTSGGEDYDSRHRARGIERADGPCSPKRSEEGAQELHSSNNQRKADVLRPIKELRLLLLLQATLSA